MTKCLLCIKKAFKLKVKLWDKGMKRRGLHEVVCVKSKFLNSMHQNHLQDWFTTNFWALPLDSWGLRLCISFSAHMRMILRGFSLLKRSLNLKSSLIYLSRFLNSLRVVLNTLMAHSVGITLLSSFPSSMLSGRNKH